MKGWGQSGVASRGSRVHVQPTERLLFLNFSPQSLFLKVNYLPIFTNLDIYIKKNLNFSHFSWKEKCIWLHTCQTPVWQHSAGPEGRQSHWIGHVFPSSPQTSRSVHIHHLNSQPGSKGIWFCNCAIRSLWLYEWIEKTIRWIAYIHHIGWNNYIKILTV